MVDNEYVEQIRSLGLGQDGADIIMYYVFR